MAKILKYKKRRIKLRLFGRIAFYFLMLFLILSAFILSYLFSIDDLKNFEPESIADMEYSCRIYDSEGNEYTRLKNTEDRIPCDLESLNKYTIDAFIAIEDTRFYEHKGIDLIRIGGAFVNDIKSMSLSEGASTISQQLIKLSKLTRKRSVSRKLTEIMMALKLEQKYSKNEILSLYLDTVYFGRGSYGIESASRNFFNKTASTLDIAESATLAGLLKAPNSFSKDIKRAKARRDLVLLNMYENGFITENEYKTAVSEDLKFCTNTKDEYPFSYYTDKVLREAKKLTGISYTELYSGGYQIYTGLNTKIQTEMERINDNPESFPKNSTGEEQVETASLVLDVKTGEISALIGGRESTGRLTFSRAYHSKRQPGSAIKPILIFAPAIEYLGYSPSSFLLDSNIDFDGWTPYEKKYKGWMSLRDVCAYSTNVPAVSLLKEIGIDRAKNYASSVGVQFSEDDTKLNLALGYMKEGISPLTLASAYLPFANGGNYMESYTIRKITDKDGNTIYEHKSLPYSVISKRTAYLISSMLSSVTEYGTASTLSETGIPLCAKTGTSEYENEDENRDAWIVAYNPEYLFCCWMGYDKNDGNTKLEKGTTGGTYPAKFAKNIFEKIYENKTAPYFELPKGIEAVKIDKDILKSKYTALLASADSKSTYTEYFLNGNAPKDYALYFYDELPDDFSVNYASIHPIISFTGQKGMIYSIFSTDATGIKKKLTQITGTGSLSSYMDFSGNAEALYEISYALPENGTFKNKE